MSQGNEGYRLEAPVVVQVGHRGRVRGRTGAPGEVELCLTLARRLRENVCKRGVDCRVVDAWDRRGRIRTGAFLSLHADGARSSSVSGYSLGFPPECRDYAGDIAHAYKEAVDLPFRGANTTSALREYYMWRRVDGPKCLLELCFVTNPDDVGEVLFRLGNITDELGGVLADWGSRFQARLK